MFQCVHHAHDNRISFYVLIHVNALYPFLLVSIRFLLVSFRFYTFPTRFYLLLLVVLPTIRVFVKRYCVMVQFSRESVMALWVLSKKRYGVIKDHGGPLQLVTSK